MTNTRSGSGRSRSGRRDRRATVASALDRVAAQPNTTPSANTTVQPRRAAKVYDTARPRRAAKVYDTAQSSSAAKVYDTARPHKAAKVYDTTQSSSAAKVYSTPAAPAASTPARSTAQPRTTTNRQAAAQPRSAARVNTTPATSARRSYLGEPAPVDHSGEFRAIRHDLRRILLWASLLIVAMLALAFLVPSL